MKPELIFMKAHTPTLITALLQEIALARGRGSLPEAAPARREGGAGESRVGTGPSTTGLEHLGYQRLHRSPRRTFDRSSFGAIAPSFPTQGVSFAALYPGSDNIVSNHGAKTWHLDCRSSAGLQKIASLTPLQLPPSDRKPVFQSHLSKHERLAWGHRGNGFTDATISMRIAASDRAMTSMTPAPKSQRAH
jgi:hypothetical protein